MDRVDSSIRMKHYYEYSAKPEAQTDRSVKYPKVYGVVEFEIEVTELLENISIALHYLQKLDLISATNCELRIFQKDIIALSSGVTNLKYQIQKTFKDITFQEDIYYSTPSKDRIGELSSREMTNKQKSKMDEAQNESVTFHRRFVAGCSIIASGKQHLQQEDVKMKQKEQKSTATDPNVFEEIIENSRYSHSESTNLSSYDFSDNSEIQTAKKQNSPKNLKLEKIKNSEKVKKISDSVTFLKPIKYKQLKYDFCESQTTGSFE